MGRPRKITAPVGVEPAVADQTPPKPKLAGVEIRILQDGVFVSEDVRKDTGDTATASADVAKILIERGHAKRL